jgi:hypothetical protein
LRSLQHAQSANLGSQRWLGSPGYRTSAPAGESIRCVRRGPTNSRVLVGCLSMQRARWRHGRLPLPSHACELRLCRHQIGARPGRPDKAVLSIESRSLHELGSQWSAGFVLDGRTNMYGTLVTGKSLIPPTAQQPAVETLVFPPCDAEVLMATCFRTRFLAPRCSLISSAGSHLSGLVSRHVLRTGYEVQPSMLLSRSENAAARWR